MKILHVNKFVYRRGGAEAYMEDVAALQRDAGHETAFFGMDHPDMAASPYRDHFPSYVPLDPPPSGMAGKARAAGRMIYSPSARRGIEYVVDDFKPDVVHMHNIYHQLSPSILRPLAKRGIPAVMTLHDYKLVCPNYQLLDHGSPCEACIPGKFRNAIARRCKDGSLASSVMVAVESYAQRLTNAYDPVQIFVCPSRFILSKMTAGNVYPDRLRHVPHFVDTDSIGAKDRPGGDLIFAGRLERTKGVAPLIEAVARIDATLDVAGDGPDAGELMRLAEERAPGRVRFLGRLAKDVLHARVRANAVTVVPSVWHENQPLSVLESFACGVPVVGTTLGGIPELIEPGVTGDLVPPNDPDALAVTLQRLLGDRDATFQMGVTARKIMEEERAPAAHVARLDEIYDEAAKRIRV